MRFFRLAKYSFIFLIFFGFHLVALAAVCFSDTDAMIKNENDFSSLSLTGVIIAKNTHSSVAVLKNEGNGKAVIMKVGDNIFGMELTHVFQDGVVLKKGEKIYWLFLEKNPPFKTEIENGSQRNLVETKKSEQEIGESKNVQVNKIFPEREFNRSEVLKRVEQERTLIIKETSVVLNYMNGKIDGFKVIGLPKTGIASEVGIHKGDVIKEVNGIKLNNLSALVMLYNKISVEERYEVLIERDKKLIRQIYILK